MARSREPLSKSSHNNNSAQLGGEVGPLVSMSLVSDVGEPVGSVVVVSVPDVSLPPVVDELVEPVSGPDVWPVLTEG